MKENPKVVRVKFKKEKKRSIRMYRYPRSYSNTNFVYIICTRKLVTMNKKKKDFAIDAWEECPPSVYNDFFFIAIK